MSKNEARHEMIIPFESFANRGVHKEKTESFRESFFKDLYFQAAEAILTIDKCNKKKNEDMTNNFGFEQKLYDVQNVIAFTGRRGTGKTSAMLAFADSLVAGEYSDNSKEELKNTRFYSFPYIDASMLEKEEDIFEIVLSKMMMELNKKITAPNYRALTQYETYYNDIKESIVNVYNQYASLKKTPNFDSESSCSKMEKLAERHDIRSQIVEMIKKYIDCMLMLDGKKIPNLYTNQSNYSYLVICIDDIDMSQKSHMEVMQSIYQYLMLPKVIVMISLNFPMLSASIEKGFYSKVGVLESESKIGLNLSREQTFDFLKKIIPLDMRITTPSWRKQDYRSLASIYIDLGNKTKFTDLTKKFPRLENINLIQNRSEDENIKFTPRELIMIMLAYRTKTFLDVAGDKLHFMEPDSLRNLNDLFYLFYNMNIINYEDKDSNDQNKKEKYYRDLEANRKILLNYLYFKMIPEFNFSVEIDQELKEFAREKIQRKGRRIWDYYYKLLSQSEEKERIERLYGSNFYKEEMRKNKVENYSFGELFRILYFGSRLNFMSKEFVQTILASFSFAMPQFIEMAKSEENDDDRNPKKDEGSKDNKEKISDDKIKIQIKDNDKYGYKRIRDVFRYTLLGTWCNDLFGGRKVDIIIHKNMLPKKIGKNYKKYFYCFIYLLMLSPMSTGEKIAVYESNNKFIISAKLDPTAFIMNSVRIKRMIDLKFVINNEQESKPVTLKELIPKMFPLYNINNLENDFANILKKDKTNYNKSDTKIHWIMLKNIDLTYNVIKRAVIYQIYRSDNNLKDKKIPDNDPFKIIQSFYIRLTEKLQEEEDLYEHGGLREYGFGNEFANHPIVKLFISTSSKDIKYKDNEKCISIAWSNSPTNDDERNVLPDEMTLQNVFDYCYPSRSEIIPTLNKVYASNLDKPIKKDIALSIIELILKANVKKAMQKIEEAIISSKGES